VIKSRVRWLGHLAHVGEMINSYKVLVGTLKRREYLDDLGVDGRVILELI